MHSLKKTLTIKKVPAGESGSALSMPGPDPGICHSDPVGASFMTYADQLKSPKWQKKRLEILERNNFTCQICESTDKQLHVHHVYYDSKKKLWDYDDLDLLVLCSGCHEEWHKTINQVMKQIAYCMTNLENPLTFYKLEMMFEYYEFDTDIFDYIHKKAVEFDYPWNHLGKTTDSDNFEF